METTTLALLALALLLFGLVSKRLESTLVTAPIAFVLLGLAAGPAGLGLLHLDIEQGLLHLAAEITLIVILFTDASRIDLQCLRREHDLPQRLLLLGLPLTILAGTGVAVLLFPHWSVFSAAVLATILAPTDAALGQAVVGNPTVPVRIRQTLNVESGLNDGMALPALLIFMSACAAGHQESVAHWVKFAALQVTLGPLVGVVLGYVGGQAIELASRRGWMNHVFQSLSCITLALLAFGVAELIGGNGFIAAFIAGMTLGNTARKICPCLYEFGEAEGTLLSLLVFAAFGAVLLPPALAEGGSADWLYAALSLTLVRMIPVALGLLGLRLRGVTILFLGWFGPRGLATLLFALLVLEERLVLEADSIATVAYLTVLLSVLAHGLTAFPLAQLYGRSMSQADGAMEQVVVSEMPTR